MATSKYKSYVILSKCNYNTVDEKTLTEISEFQDCSSFETRSTERFRNEKSETLKLYLGSYHTCRETLLGSFDELNKHSKNFFPYTNFIMEYYEEDGEPISTNTLNKISEFSKRSRLSLIKIYVISEKVYISSTISPNSLIMSSLFLWIFRNKKILDDILNITPNLISQTEILKFLSKYFLEDENSGNSSNQNFFLSLYCYANSSSRPKYTAQTFYNGPVNCAKSMPFEYVYNYITNFYYPNYGNDISKLSINSEYLNPDTYQIYKLCIENIKKD